MAGYMQLADGFNVLNTTAQAIKSYTNRFDDHSQNLSRVGAISGKRQETYLTIYKALQASDTGKLEGYRINHLSEVGPPIPSKTDTNLAIGCCSYFVVKDKDTGKIGYTKIGTFDWDKDLELTNHLKQKLQVVVRDPITGVISDANTNLQPLNASKLESKATATSNISLQLQLPGNAIVGQSHTQSISVYDSLGNQKFIMLNWERVNNPAGANASTTQSWKLSVEGPNGSTVAANNASPYGNNQYGMIVEFNGVGNPLAYRSWDGATGYGAPSTTPPSLQVTNWGTAAQASAINLNLGAVGSDLGVVSTGNIFDEKKFDLDGNDKGTFDKITFDSNGFGTVAYTNGKTEAKYCRIPFAMCNSPNKLSARENGIFYPNRESGEMTYGYPNTGSTGQLIPSSLEGSTIDPTQVNVEMVEDQQRFANNLAVFKTATDTLKQLNNIIT